MGTNPPGEAPPLGAVVHPVALYDAVLVSILFVTLVLYLRVPRPAGTASAIFALYYSVDRLLLDFLRIDRTRAFGLTGTQLASIAVIVLVGAWLVHRRQQDRRAAQAWPPWGAGLATAALTAPTREPEEVQA